MNARLTPAAAMLADDLDAATCHGYGGTTTERLAVAAISDFIAPIDNSDRDPYHGTPRYPVVYCSQCGNPQGPGNAGFSLCRDHTPLIDSHQPLGPLTVLVGYRVDIDGTIDPVSVLLGGEVIPADLFAAEVTEAWATGIALERAEEGALLQEDAAQDAAELRRAA